MRIGATETRPSNTGPAERDPVGEPGAGRQRLPKYEPTWGLGSFRFVQWGSECHWKPCREQHCPAGARHESGPVGCGCTGGPGLSDSLARPVGRNVEDPGPRCRGIALERGPRHLRHSGVRALALSVWTRRLRRGDRPGKGGRVESASSTPVSPDEVTCPPTDRKAMLILLNLCLWTPLEFPADQRDFRVIAACPSSRVGSLLRIDDLLNKRRIPSVVTGSVGCTLAVPKRFVSQARHIVKLEMPQS